METSRAEDGVAQRPSYETHMLRAAISDHVPQATLDAISADSFLPSRAAAAEVDDGRPETRKFSGVLARIRVMTQPNRWFVITLTLAVAIAVGRCAYGASSAQISPLSSTSADVDISKFMGLIAGRGLADGAMPNPRAPEHIPVPLPGASVSESIVTLSKTGERVSKATMWEEPFGSGFLELQETTTAAGQTTAEYWVLTADHRRCVLNGDAVYGKDGRLLSSNFWRNDPQLRFPGSPKFPIDVFPSRIPVSAILLTLDAPEPGATGKLNVVLGRYGYMAFDLWAQNTEQITVPAGTFRTYKIIMQVEADSVMKYWPAFLRRLAQPFFPKNVLYYDTAPPHHLVQFVGSFGYLAPEVTVQLTRVYIASESGPDVR